MNFSTLCTIFVVFGPETSEFTLLTIPPFAAIRKNTFTSTVFYVAPAWRWLRPIVEGGVYQDWTNPRTAGLTSHLKFPLCVRVDWDYRILSTQVQMFLMCCTTDLE